MRYSEEKIKNFFFFFKTKIYETMTDEIAKNSNQKSNGKIYFLCSYFIVSLFYYFAHLNIRRSRRTGSKEYNFDQDLVGLQHERKFVHFQGSKGICNKCFVDLHLQ